MRSSWISALILVLVLFPAYYIYIYATILKVYESQFDERTYILSSPTTDASLNDLEITARIPRYVYPAEKIWVYIRVENKGFRTISDASLYLTLNPPTESILLPSISTQDDKYVAKIFLGNVERESTVIVRIPLLVQDDTDIGSVWLQRSILESNGQLSIQDPVEWISSGITLTLRINTAQAIKHSFIESILLPPWSNGTIAVLAMLASYLGCDNHGRKKATAIKSAADKNIENEPNVFTLEMTKMVWENLAKSIIILSFFAVPILWIIYGSRGFSIPVVTFLIIALFSLTKNFVDKYVPAVGRNIKKIKKWALSQLEKKSKKLLDTWASPKIVNYSLITLGIVLLVVDGIAIFYLDRWKDIDLIGFSTDMEIGIILLLLILGCVLGLLGIFYEPKLGLSIRVIFFPSASPKIKMVALLTHAQEKTYSDGPNQIQIRSTTGEILVSQSFSVEFIDSKTTKQVDKKEMVFEFPYKKGTAQIKKEAAQIIVLTPNGNTKYDLSINSSRKTRG
jgi:hypothetical protein